MDVVNAKNLIIKSGFPEKIISLGTSVHLQ